MSEIQIYSEGFELVINVDGVRIALNLPAAQQLQAALAKAVPLLQKEHEAAQASHQVLLSTLKQALAGWDDRFAPQRSLACDILATGQVKGAFELLEAVSGPAMAWNGFSSLLAMQSDGWVTLRSEWPMPLLIGLSEMASNAPSETVLARLWDAHADTTALLVGHAQQSLLTYWGHTASRADQLAGCLSILQCLVPSRRA